MRKKGLARKLFFLSFGLFSIILGLQIGFQILFLGDFYLNKKIKQIEERLYIFSDRYKDSDWGLTEKKQEINRFIEQNNSPLIMTSDRGLAETLNNYTIVISDEEGDFYEVISEAFFDYSSYEDFEELIGSNIYLEGFFTEKEGGPIEPFLVETDEIDYYNEQLFKEYSTDGLDVIKLEGEIEFFNELIHEEALIYKNEILLTEIDHWFYEDFEGLRDLKDGEVFHYSYNDEAANLDNIIFVHPIRNSQGEQEYLFVMTSLQPINETIETMNQFNLYLTIFVLLLIVLSSYLFSRKISTPLLKMNETAKRMANLDFTEESSIKTNDELESLSESLNTLSKNLVLSLNELQKANNQLVDDIEKERQQERIRREFVANISHELKTPLGIMKGFAEGIKDGIYEQKKDYYLDVILEEIDSMNRLVLDMLELSKLESGGQYFNKEVFNLKELIENVHELFSHQLREKEMTVKLLLEAVNVYGDKRMVKQVLRNLIDNGIRYSPKGGKLVILIEKNMVDVKVSIENVGANIPEEEIDKVWDRFYRIEKSRNRGSGGTGLGLVIVKAILDNHGSKYGVKNTDSGVEFHFTLSLASLG